MINKNINSEDIDALVVSAQSGDTEAFSSIYDQYFSHIYRYIYYRANKEEVDDLVARVFMKAWDNLGKYKPKGASFGAWLFKIAHNLVVDQYRAHRSIDEIPINLADERISADPQKVANNSLNQVVLKKALWELKEIYRNVIVLKFINGFSNQEIAEIMKRNEGNIRILQFRALKELKVSLEKMGYEWGG
ncbi:MAG: hypothetical protein ACD_51C00280G0017 [uncultured bacterium]|nr:MAG: hypothetical protein ACD_51C00280G0017 [uncultured bacterium]